MRGFYRPGYSPCAIFSLTLASFDSHFVSSCYPHLCHISIDQLLGLSLDEFKLCAGTIYVGATEPKEYAALTKSIASAGLYDTAKVWRTRKSSVCRLHAWIRALGQFSRTARGSGH